MIKKLSYIYIKGKAREKYYFLQVETVKKGEYITDSYQLWKTSASPTLCQKACRVIKPYCIDPWNKLVTSIHKHPKSELSALELNEIIHFLNKDKVHNKCQEANCELWTTNKMTKGFYHPTF